MVEGFFDAIAVHHAGYPVVALMGSTVSRRQADLLSAHVDRVVLMLDGDDAGRQGAVSVAQTLGERLSISTISLDVGCQPDQLTSDQIRKLAHEHARTRTTEAR